MTRAERTRGKATNRIGTEEKTIIDSDILLTFPRFHPSKLCESIQRLRFIPLSEFRARKEEEESERECEEEEGRRQTIPKGRERLG